MPISDIPSLLNLIAEPNRLRILLALSGRKMCVCELCSALGLGQVIASQHLRVLRDCGLVMRSKNGLWVDYEMPDTVLAGPAGRVFKTILAEARKDRTLRKDREAAAKADRRLIRNAKKK